MKSKSWSAFLCVGMAGVCGGGALAAEPGFYLAASLGQADEDAKSNGTNVGNSFGVFHVDPDSVTVDDGNTAWSVAVGYQMNRFMAAELEYVDFGSTGISEHYSVPNQGPIPFPTEFDKDYSSNVTGPAVSLLGTFPIGEHFEIFVRGGALFASRQIELGSIGTLDEKFASTVWLAGGGATWSFTKHWAIRAEYQQTGTLDETIVSGETKLKRLALSGLFRF